MRSFIPLSLLLAVFDSFLHFSSAIKIPFEVHTPHLSSNSLVRRDSLNLTNQGNAQYIANVTIGGQVARVIIDTGSSDLWANFPQTQPTSNDLGKGLTLNYAIGAAGGNIHSASVQFDGYTIDNQAFLLVTDASSFSSNIHDQGYDGLMGLGPNAGSQILDKLDDDADGNSVLYHIFQKSSSNENYITFFLNRNGDPSAPPLQTGQLTINEVLNQYQNISQMPKLDLETVHRLLKSEQHWQALTDKNNGIIGPDGNVINVDSIVPKAPDGQLVAVFDSGFTFSQVPRDVSDAIYGRVQGAVYDSKNEWWTVPCGQMLNISFNFGGVNYPVHPLDTVDDNFGLHDDNGNHICIGSFQPITSAFSLLGNYDMIMGMSFLRNAYTLMSYGSWVEGSSDPYISLLPLTDPNEAHSSFVTARLEGQDTSASSQYNLLPPDQLQHSPVSAEEKKKKYQEMILSRWPYIFAGCLIFVLLVVGLVIWRCCCRRNKNKNKGGKGVTGTRGMSMGDGGKEFGHKVTSSIGMAMKGFGGGSGTGNGAGSHQSYLQLHDPNTTSGHGGPGFRYDNGNASSSVMSVQTLTDTPSASPSYGKEFGYGAGYGYPPSPMHSSHDVRDSYSTGGARDSYASYGAGAGGVTGHGAYGHGQQDHLNSGYGPGYDSPGYGYEPQPPTASYHTQSPGYSPQHGQGHHV
ncbi:hypothetical protein D9758_013441 [Tetrapyrgos nigripes]|uniref:Peptidase A1 domain-containing protein n=1 Tax=Tetrapyrgos nigripes TaxID=182062 RepID=A0A8H5CKY4_9AGAR|nr:hypothetical protein D9758_013441 [Tetrapyrgos nigripes]